MSVPRIFLWLDGLMHYFNSGILHEDFLLELDILNTKAFASEGLLRVARLPRFTDIHQLEYSVT